MYIMKLNYVYSGEKLQEMLKKLSGNNLSKDMLWASTLLTEFTKTVLRKMLHHGHSAKAKTPLQHLEISCWVQTLFQTCKTYSYSVMLTVKFDKMLQQ